MGHLFRALIKDYDCKYLEDADVDEAEWDVWGDLPHTDGWLIGSLCYNGDQAYLLGPVIDCSFDGMNFEWWACVDSSTVTAYEPDDKYIVKTEYNSFLARYGWCENKGPSTDKPLLFTKMQATGIINGMLEYNSQYLIKEKQVWT